MLKKIKLYFAFIKAYNKSVKTKKCLKQMHHYYITSDFDDETDKKIFSLLVYLHAKWTYEVLEASEIRKKLEGH